MSMLEPGKWARSVCIIMLLGPGPRVIRNHGFVRSSQELLPVQGLDPHPEEEDGDESDDEDHEEGDGDADEGGGVDAQRVGQAVGVDHNLLLILAGQRKLDVVGSKNLWKEI